MPDCIKIVINIFLDENIANKKYHICTIKQADNTEYTKIYDELKAAPSTVYIRVAWGGLNLYQDFPIPNTTAGYCRMIFFKVWDQYSFVFLLFNQTHYFIGFEYNSYLQWHRINYDT